MQLGGDQLEQLKTALRQPELTMVHETYPQLFIGIDSNVFETIKFEIDGKPRTVALVNPDLEYLQNKTNYPAALINLLTEIKQVRQQMDADGK